LLAPLSGPAVINLPSITGLSYYTDPNCSYPYTGNNGVPLFDASMGLSAGTYVYFKYGGSTTPISLTPTVAATPTPAVNTTVSGSAQTSLIWATKLTLTGASVTQVGLCAPLGVNLTDANNNPAPAQAAMNVALTFASNAVGHSLYSDSYCTTALTSLALTAGQMGGAIYYRATSAGNESLTASATGFSSSTLSFTVSPPPPTNFIILTPGQTFSGSGSLPSQVALTSGSAITLTVIAVSNPATGVFATAAGFSGAYTLMENGLNINGSPGSSTSATLTFSNGQATVNYTPSATDYQVTFSLMASVNSLPALNSVNGTFMVSSPNVTPSPTPSPSPSPTGAPPQVVLYGPGQTLPANPSTSAFAPPSTNPTLMQGVPASFTAYAVTPTGASVNMIPNFAGTYVISAGSGGGTFATTSVTFTAGVATFTYTPGPTDTAESFSLTSANGGLTVVNPNYAASAIVPNQIILLAPGQSFTSPSIAPSTVALPPGAATSLTAIAVVYSPAAGKYFQATSFSGSYMLNAAGSGGASTARTLIFSGGQAQVSYTTLATDTSVNFSVTASGASPSLSIVNGTYSITASTGPTQLVIYGPAQTLPVSPSSVAFTPPSVNPALMQGTSASFTVYAVTATGAGVLMVPSFNGVYTISSSAGAGTFANTSVTFTGGVATFNYTPGSTDTAAFFGFAPVGSAPQLSVANANYAVTTPPPILVVPPSPLTATGVQNFLVRLPAAPGSSTINVAYTISASAGTVAGTDFVDTTSTPGSLTFVGTTVALPISVNFLTMASGKMITVTATITSPACTGAGCTQPTFSTTFAF
jgi:hypothetical protein